MDSQNRSGGCQCGAVRYHITAKLEHAGFCHCRMCQKAFGGMGAALVSVPLDQFAWTRGRPAEFRSSAHVARGFCAACGTPLYMQDDDDSNIEIAICTLDDPNAITPDHQVGVEGKLTWFDTLHRLPGETTEQNSPRAAAGHYKTLQHPDWDTDSWPPAKS
jgi:hypothetical protein